jgi:oleandomycin transport system ATP-binding protein
MLEDAVLALPVTHSGAAAEAVRALDGIGVGIAGLEVRTPTLDDVFFTLTGKHVEPDDAERELAA